MTQLKCPFCGKELQLALNVDGREFYWCKNYDCDGVNYGVGNKELWQALIDTKKKLDIAVDALNEIKALDDNGNYDVEDYDCQVAKITTQALDQINEIKGVSDGLYI